MKCLRHLGYGSWLASMGLSLPGVPHQCNPDQTYPGVGGSTSGTASACGAAAGSATCGAAAGSATAGAAASGGTANAVAGAATVSAGGTASSVAGAATVSTGGAVGGAAGAASSTTAASSCGNGRVDPGEECDDGTGNGPTGRCDTYCFLACEGPCPIRVDPAASINGSGRDWSHPANQIQSAIDRQAARGGGEIRIKAGDFDLSDVDGMSGFKVPSNVSVLGGYIGDTTITQTTLRGRREAALLSIESATYVVVEGLDLVDADPPFRVVDSRDVSLIDIGVPSNEEYTANGIEVINSSVHFEVCSFSMPMTGYGFVITNSDASFAATAVTAPEISSLSPKLRAQGSRLLVERSAFHRGVIIDVSSQALFVDSSLLNTHAPGAALYVDGRAAVVGTTFGNGWGDAAVHADGSVLIFDSDFRGYVTAVHGGYPVAWAIVGSGTVEVSLSSFMGGACVYPRDTPCPAIQSGSGSIENSFFVYDEHAGPRYTGGPFAPEDQVLLGAPMPPSNCVVAASRSDYASEGRISGPYPCIDQGDAARLSASQARLLESYAGPFVAAPFNVDLSHYLDGDFWRAEAVTTSTCGDVNAPDPGRHYPCSP